MEPPASKKPFLGVLFECCNIYRRVYLDPTRRRFLGQCPRCARQVVFAVDDRQGKKARFWRAG